MTLAHLIWIALGLGILMPAVLAATAPRRRLVLLLAIWSVSPVPMYAGMVTWEALTRPGVAQDPGDAFYGFMLVGPIVAPPWALACLTGAGLGLVIRRLLRPCSARPS